jgi:hypothetical protein
VDALLVVVLLAGLILWARFPSHPPEPAGVDVSETAFSAERALEHLRVIAAGPHLPGTPAHGEVRGYLAETLRSLGIETEIQSATSVRSRGGRIRAVEVWNVLGRISGTDPTGAVLLMAHYDAVQHSSGASDDGTGVAAILEALRAFRQGPPPKNDIVVLISDAEELGLMGARAFVEGHRWASEISVVLNFEMRGHGGASMMFENGPENGWVVKQWAMADPHPVGNSMSQDIYRRMPNDTDFSPFRNRGIQGLNYGAIGGGNLYHLSLDDLSHNSPATLQHQGIQALAMTRHLANADLTQTHAPDLAYVRVALFGLIIHPQGWNWVGLALALVLAGCTLLVGLRARSFRVKGLLAGVGLAAASLVLSALGGWLVFRGVQGFHPEYGRLVGSSFHREGWYVLAVVAVSGALFLRLMGFGRRWFSLPELAWGGALIPLLLGVVLAGVAPLAALNFVWSVLFGEAALLLFLLRLDPPPEDGPSRKLALVGLGLLLVPVVFVLVPVAESLWVAMSISFAPVLAVVVTLTLILLLPLLAPLQYPNRWWAPVLLGAFALLSIGIGLSRSGAGPENPTPTSLFYVMDRDQGTAWWATSDASNEAWIRSRIPDPTLREEEGAFYPRGYFTASAEPADVAEPRIEVLEDTVGAGRRVLRLGITSAIDAEMLELRPADGGDVALLGVGDWTAEESHGGEWTLEHWGDPGGPVEVEISLPPEAAGAELLLRETTFGPQRILGDAPFQRPPHLIPGAPGRSDSATFGTRIRIPPEVSGEAAGIEVVTRCPLSRTGMWRAPTTPSQQGRLQDPQRGD